PSSLPHALRVFSSLLLLRHHQPSSTLFPYTTLFRSLCYTALHRREVANLVTLTTPVDFHTPDNLLSKWVRELDTELLRQSGNVPGEALNGLFLALMPFRLTQQKYVRLLAGNSDQRALEDL